MPDLLFLTPPQTHTIAAPFIHRPNERQEEEKRYSISGKKRALFAHRRVVVHRRVDMEFVTSRAEGTNDREFWRKRTLFGLKTSQRPAVLLLA